MKRLITILLLLSSCFIFDTTRAQAPQAISYQAVARDNSGNPITNHAISLRFTVHDLTTSGAIVYRETQSKTTNAFGLFTANFGQGTIINGTFAAIDWGGGSKFMQVEMDAAGGITYSDMGTQQMLSVPYALNAGNGNWTKNGNDINNSNSGRVGIGTASPAHKFEVKDNSSLSVMTVQNSSTSGYSVIDFYDYAGNGICSFGYANPAAVNLGGHSYLASSAPLSFIVGSSFDERMRIDNVTGNVGVGTTTPTAKFQVNGSAILTNTQDASSGNVGIGASPIGNSKCYINSNQTYGLQINSPASTGLGGAALYVTGDAAKTSGGSSWIIVSDSRLKENVTSYTEGLEQLMKINPVKYHYTEASGMDSKKEYVGVLAQQLKEVAPYMVGKFINQKDNKEYLDVDNSAMTYMLINAVKEQQRIIESMKAENDKMREDLQLIKAQLDINKASR